MKNTDKMKALATVSRYNIIFTLIIGLISILLVFSTPLINGVDQITTQLTNVQDILSKIPNDLLNSISDLIDVVGNTSEYLSLIVILVGIILILLLFLVVLIVDFIIKAIVKSENSSEESSLSKRIVIFILLLINMRVIIFMLFSSVVHAFIGMDVIFVVLLIFLLLCLVLSFAFLAIDTYHRIMNREYVTRLFLLELFKVVVIVVGVLFVFEFIKQMAMYLFIRNLLIDINYFDVLQLDVIIQYIFDILNTTFTNTLPEVDIPLTGFVSQSLIDVSESNFNELIKIPILDIVDDIFLQTIYNAVIGFVLSVIVFVSSTKVTNSFAKNNILVYIFSSLILIFFIYITTPIILASSLATTLLIIIFIHIYQVIVHYELFDTVKEKYHSNQESSKSSGKNDIINEEVDEVNDELQNESKVKSLEEDDKEKGEL